MSTMKEDNILDDSEQDAKDEKAKAEEELKQYWRKYVVKPDMVEELWKDDDPVTIAEDMILEHIEVLGQDSSQGKDYNQYNEFEKRYEHNQELKWLAKFIVESLILLKHDLKMENEETIAELLNIFWKTLDFLNGKDQITNGGAAVHGRFNILQDNLKKQFEKKAIDRNQAQEILIYMKKTLFSHMQLYINCLGAKQSRLEKPLVIMIDQPQQAPSGLDPTVCTEVQDEDDANVAGLMDSVDIHGSLQDSKEGGPVEDAKSVADVIDPEDPLYGLEERLKHQQLDDESRKVIINKLMDAQSQVKSKLANRRADMESRLGKKK